MSANREATMELPSFKFWLDVEKRWKAENPLDEGEYYYLLEKLMEAKAREL